MERWFDIAAVGILLGASVFVAVHARGHVDADVEDAALSVEDPPYGARVAAALPRLERHVAAGSMRIRDVECDEEERLAEIAELETAIGFGDVPEVRAPLREGIDALRACVACTPEPRGCAAAARAFTAVEQRLSLARGASGI